MKICVVSGSRADEGLLAWPVKMLRKDAFFEVEYQTIRGLSFDEAYRSACLIFSSSKPDIVLILGDRFEILATAIAAHLQRIPIAHIGGGDVTEGSYDDAMRDSISRMATLHFTTSKESQKRQLIANGSVWSRGYLNIHLVGSPGVDYIMHADWKRERPIAEPYVVVAYYPETIDDTVDLAAVNAAVAGRKVIWIGPNPDRGSERIPANVSYPHDEFLNLLYHCDEFIGNSSAMFYEAPFLGVKTRVIGKRQRGRVVPFGDGHASERIVKILKERGIANLQN